MAIPTETIARDFITELRDSIMGPNIKPLFSQRLESHYFDVREVWPWGNSVVFPTEPYEDGSGSLIAAVRYQNFGWVT